MLGNETVSKKMRGAMASVRVLASFLIFIISTQATADCYVVDALKGWSVKERDNYELIKDGFSQDKFYLRFGDNGEDSWMSNNPNSVKIPCTNAGILTCVDRRDSDTVLSWAIDFENKTVVHTRVYAGSIFSDGASLMVGDLVGTCKD